MNGKLKKDVNNLRYISLNPTVSSTSTTRKSRLTSTNKPNSQTTRNSKNSSSLLKKNDQETFFFQSNFSKKEIYKTVQSKAY